MRSNKTRHIILGFYSANDGDPKQAFEASRRVGASGVLIDGASGSGSDKFSKFAGLRLDGEILVVASGSGADVEPIAKALEGTGSPAIFVFREDPHPTPPSPHRESIFDRLRENELRLEDVRDNLAEAARMDRALTASAEWLLDNSYLVRTQISEVRRHLPRNFPKTPSANGFEPVLGFARDLIVETDHSVNENNITSHLLEFQKTAPLSTAELWFFPLFLRIALIEKLADLASAVSRAQQLREAAYLWANRLSTSVRSAPQEFSRLLSLMEAEPMALQPYFVTSLAEQLQDEETALAPMRAWIQEHYTTPLTELVRSEHTHEAAQLVSVANAFGSLRALSRIDFTEIFEAVSLVEKELLEDPAGIYGQSDFASRDQCRQVVERISRYSSMSEVAVARTAVRLATEAADPRMRTVMQYLLTPAVKQLEEETKSHVPLRVRMIRGLRKNATTLYLGSYTLLTASFLTLALVLAWEGGAHRKTVLVLLSLLALFPLSELAQQIINALVISLLPPDQLPKLDFKSGIPVEDTTLVVVPILLASPEVVHKEIEKIEVRFLANREENLYFSLFSDFLDSPHASASGDQALLQAARDGIRRLNERYSGQRFLLFHRNRVWSETERKWIGRERKRGKIEDLNAFLNGVGAPGILAAGKVPSIRYVITLDADTQLPSGTARRLIETIAHPLNQVEADADTRTRRRGFGIIQPRVSIALPGATATRFTRIFASTTGTDPYCQAVSDAQQDLFGEGIFHGKAIYDVRAFHETLNQRFPAETLLSHDLIEGSFVGVALASDIELFENLPLDYVSYTQRQHRWIRGDWQIAPWIFSTVPTGKGTKEPNPLPLISRWRIFDNLRRSLVAPASLLLLLFGWLMSPAPGVWSLVLGVAIALLALAPLLDHAARRLRGSLQGWQGATDELIRSLVMIAFLPHQAWVSIDAIVRVAYRRGISHHHLLEWQTAEAAGLDAHRHLSRTMQQMIGISGFSILMMIVLHGRGALAPTFIFLLLWTSSPLLMWWLNRSAPLYHRERPDTLFLRRTARRTWRFFDDLVNDESSWLPPDNTQLALRIEVAQRTSPTNIGLWLTSALAATDLGYLTSDDFLDRCTRTMRTLDQLERYEGHFLNWYDTRTRQPLLPRYVSTVDSGNLLACFWVLSRGCEDLLNAPLLPRACTKGIADTLAILREAWAGDPSMRTPLRALRRLIHGKSEGHQLIGQLRLLQAPLQQLKDSRRWQEEGEERSYWVTHLAREIGAWTATVDRYLRWMETLTAPPDSFLDSLRPDASRLRGRALRTAPTLLTLAEGASGPVEAILAWRGTPEIRPDIAAWLDQLAGEYRQAKVNAVETVQRMRQLAADANRFAEETKMRLLYDASRRLFGVGYAVGGPLEFNSHYDLLASECRLASLVAIAKGEVPAEHWYAMARPLASSHGGRTLLSWSGTMFEYLMPLLFTRSFSNSLLDHACRDAVAQQIAYGHEKEVPWGVSEAAYSALDANQIYQYKAFGVPNLALKPGLEDDLVVSPYSSMLALLVDSEAALDNLRRLVTFDLDGPMGFYESIDFSRENSRDGKPGIVIYTYMAHHQGMSLLALDAALHHDVMRHRFHRDVRIRAVESLLFERMATTPLPEEEAKPSVIRRRTISTEELPERTWKEDTPFPRVHLQGNGRYALMITSAGGGYSRSGDFDVSRWRSDTARDSWGSFIYIRDLRSAAIWSATYQPVGGSLGTSSATFSPDRAEFQRTVLGVESVMDVAIAAEDDVELRRLTVTNRTLRKRQLELTSYVELSLAPHRADVAHPAFAKMFVETEAFSEDTLIAHRRPRSPEEPQIWAAHFLIGASSGIQHETDRAIFLGRGNTVSSPERLRQDLTGSTGPVLDPIFSLRCSLEMEARNRVEITFITLTAPTRESLLALVDKYKRPESITRAFQMAWTRAQLEFRYLGIDPSAAHRFQELASHLIYPNARLRPPSDRLVLNKLGQSALWAYGVSGDLPMLVVTIADARGIPLLRELLLAHNFWRLRGLRIDLIVFNQEVASYEQPLKTQLLRQIEAHESNIDKPGGVFLRDWNSLPDDHRNLFLAAATVVLAGGRGSLKQQLSGAGEPVPSAAFLRSGSIQEQVSRPLPFLELPYFNGLGGFTPDGKEYATYLKPGSHTPSAWVNVMANPTFGAMVSESGLGCTWSGNSQANRLTPWHNDPVTDPQSEAIYIRDDETGAIWTPTPLPVRENDAYRTRHGQGYTSFEHNSHAIGQQLTVFVPASDPVKIYRLRLRNDGARVKKLTITYFAEWVLGPNREDQQIHVQTSRDEESGALLATQTWNGSFAHQIAFAASSPKAASYSSDRVQFLGRNGSISHPFALGRIRLDNRTGAGLDPAAALQLSVSIEPGQETEVTFLMGEVSNVEAMRAILARYNSPRLVDESLSETRRWWDDQLGGLQVRTPLLSVDFLLNRWLPYQTLSCRFWGRTALHQSSGAFGYRDQLQDSLAFLYFAPHLTRAHILAAAARQFLEGDVQHWWHAETGLGVRTRCSDDMGWLTFVVAHYIEVTGDSAILDEQVPFLEAPPLKDGELERMFIPSISQRSGSLFEHCQLALDRMWRPGPHGLPLMGTGDWNDGMNHVGSEGRGESVWLAWFYSTTASLFARVIENRDAGAAAKLRENSRQLAQTVEQTCWDGEWYLRAFFDNGTPLGSHVDAEAQIDSIAQSWAVLSGEADAAHALQALQSCERMLVKEKDRVVLLFTPAFDRSQPHPGYIMGYPPGVRENGGQYTHGSLWLAAAWARLGDGGAAVRLLKLMNPIESSRTPEATDHFKGEPYVSPADVSFSPGREGRAGWTWYTGSAGWMYRIWIEEVLGFHLRGDTLTISPAIPDDWDGFDISYRYKSTLYEFSIHRDTGDSETGSPIHLIDDGQPHKIALRLARVKIDHPEPTLAGAMQAN
ncbi:MAG TPA: glucoamylase family protein [Bryobacteraceae bacterium]|nr:glucoamylase family protein [Bryobacteraceae bacterium]